MAVGGVVAETEVNRPVALFVEGVHCDFPYLTGQHVDDDVDLPELVQFPAVIERIAVVDSDVLVEDDARLGVHVVNVDFVPPVGEPACDIGSDEAGPEAVNRCHGAAKAAEVFGLTVRHLVPSRGDALIEGIAGHEPWRVANASTPGRPTRRMTMRG